MHRSLKSNLLLFCLLFTLSAVSACEDKVIDSAESGQTSSQKSSPTEQANQKTAESVKSSPNYVKVFFPKSPESEQDFTYVESVVRTTSGQGLAPFAIEQLIAGPTSQEKNRGLVAPINLQGSSNCGKDFTLSINNGVARLQFCKTVASEGVGDDVRTNSSINATLGQFSTINSVIILDKNSNCLGDQSGENFCLKKAQKPEKLTEQSKLAINGIGPIEVGMTVAQASRAAGVQLEPTDPDASSLCSDYKPSNGPEGVRFTVTDGGRISRVDIDSLRITTINGARIGDTEARIQSLYPGQIQVNPLPNSKKGHYLTVIPDKGSDKNFRLIFETDGQRVQRMRTGKLPEVAFIGGCLDIRPGF